MHQTHVLNSTCTCIYTYVHVRIHTYMYMHFIFGIVLLLWCYVDHDIYVYMYRLTHGFRRYTGNIPEVLITTARGRSPRAVYSDKHRGYFPVYLLKPWVNLFVARAASFSWTEPSERCVCVQSVLSGRSVLLPVALL